MPSHNVHFAFCWCFCCFLTAPMQRLFSQRCEEPWPGQERCELFLYILIGNDEMQLGSMDPSVKEEAVPGFPLLVNRATWFLFSSRNKIIA